MNDNTGGVSNELDYSLGLWRLGFYLTNCMDYHGGAGSTF